MPRSRTASSPARVQGRQARPLPCGDGRCRVGGAGLQPLVADGGTDGGSPPLEDPPEGHASCLLEAQEGDLAKKVAELPPRDFSAPPMTEGAKALVSAWRKVEALQAALGNTWNKDPRDILREAQRILG